MVDFYGDFRVLRTFGVLFGALILIGCGLNDIDNKNRSGKEIIFVEKNSQGLVEYKHEQTGMILVCIPSGEFMMGSEDGDIDEKPMHLVKVSSFLISKYEVTQEVWERVMGNNPSYFRANNNPVELVSWNQCKKFCIKTGLRLPTEAEWEYACKAGTKTKYYWGNNLDGNYLWYGDNSGEMTHQVGGKIPNGYGLFDMSGNVWEWCEDWYGLYESGMNTSFAAPSSGQHRVLRGGDWLGRENGCRSSDRKASSPETGNNYIGLRVSLDF